MYKQGQIDFAEISGTSAIYQANKNNKDVVDASDARTTYIIYNQTGSVKALTNQKIRQALNLATDRKGVVKAAVDTGSTPAESLVPKKLAKLPNGEDLSKYTAQVIRIIQVKLKNFLKKVLLRLVSHLSS